MFNIETINPGFIKSSDHKINYKFIILSPEFGFQPTFLVDYIVVLLQCNNACIKLTEREREEHYRHYQHCNERLYLFHSSAK